MRVHNLKLQIPKEEREGCLRRPQSAYGAGRSTDVALENEESQVKRWNADGAVYLVDGGAVLVYVFFEDDGAGC